MTQLKFSVKLKNDLSRAVTRKVQQATNSATRTIAQDLARASSGATPHKTGDLEGSYSIAYSLGLGKSSATVEYAVYHKGYNYALAMHEGVYNLGEGSLAKGGGTGMSGKTYSVGRKFLTRVLEGESETYKEYYKTQIKRAIGG